MMNEGAEMINLQEDGYFFSSFQLFQPLKMWTRSLPDPKRTINNDNQLIFSSGSSYFTPKRIRQPHSLLKWAYFILVTY